MMRNRYKSLSIIIPVEYDSIFSGIIRENAPEVLRMISRESAVKLASLLKREYCGQPAIKIVQLLSNTDPHYVPLYNHIKRYVETISNERGAEVVVAFDSTPLEFLRVAFSIPPSEMKEVSPLKTDELQWRITKLLTQINQNLMEFKAPKTSANNIAKLLMVNDASYKDVYKINLN